MCFSFTTLLLKGMQYLEWHNDFYQLFDICNIWKIDNIVYYWRIIDQV